MSESDLDKVADTANQLQDAVELSMLIVTALNGDSTSQERLEALAADGHVVTGEFPGSRQRALGHALKYVEDLEELGIDARREYVDETEFGHRVDIHFGESELPPSQKRQSASGDTATEGE